MNQSITLVSAGFLDLSPAHLIVLLIVVLLVFGPSRLPELSKAIGKSVRYFKKGLSDMKDELENTPPPDEEKKPADTTTVTVEPVKPAITGVHVQQIPAPGQTPGENAPQKAESEKK